MNPPRIGVVIPFFQRQSGLLRLAVESILAQSVVRAAQCTIQIIVIDDSSPAPAADDLTGLVMPPGIDLLLHRQVNGGAGAARNAAIDRLDDACETLAFLDSDDVWSPDHLARALQALAAGADFYFCDAVRREDEHSLNAEDRGVLTIEQGGDRGVQDVLKPRSPRFPPDRLHRPNYA